MMLRAAVALAIVLLLHSGASAEKRVALVIGNGAYAKVPQLTNPARDAAAVEGLLRAAGFEVVESRNDLSNATMRRALRDFSDQVRGAHIAVVFYAGHGIEVGGTNYLIPVDAKLEQQSHVEDEAVPLSRVMSKVTSASKLQLVILDACRNNPFAQSASRALVPTDNPDGRARSDSAGGLAPMEALVGTLIAFATAPESVAADGSGKNGVYTENLLRNITEPGLRIEDVFKRTRFGVRQETGGRQVPWENTSLEGDFYFVAPATGSVASSGSAGQSTTVAGGQQAALQPSRSDTPVVKPVRSPSGFSFAREEEKDRATRFAKADEIRARLQAPCPEALRQRPIVIDITEESHADGLIATDRSSRFAQLVNQNLQQAGLTTNLASAQEQPAGRAGRLLARAGRIPYPQGHYSIQGVVLSQQGANRVARLHETSVNAELALRDPAGRIITMVEVSGERFAGQNTNAAAWILTKEQANNAASQLYAAFCGSRH
jgi:hypothetical protein